jgi:nitronate monooxygenase
MSNISSLFSNVRLPVICSPMFIISHPPMVIEQCKAGVVGSMPALNARPADQLKDWLEEITLTLAAHDRDFPSQPSAPFAINQIVHKSNDRLAEDMEIIAHFKVPLVITSLGSREEINDAVHAYGGIVMHDIINNTFAKKAIEKGADGLIAVAAGAGGRMAVSASGVACGVACVDSATGVADAVGVAGVASGVL